MTSNTPDNQSNTLNKLSDPAIRAAKPKEKLYRLRDGGGLSCDILTTGKKVWRYAYRFNNKQKTYTIGEYPTIGLSEARKRRNEAKQQVTDGIDPSLQKQLKKLMSIDNTFEEISKQWLAKNKPDWSPRYHDRIESYFRRDVYPWIGELDVKDIEAPLINTVLEKIAERGAVDAAKRVKQFIQQSFDYAFTKGKVTRNPARDINLAMVLPKTVKNHYAAITDPVTLGGLLRAVEGYQGSITVRIALRAIPHVMLRPSELGNAEWSEIDFDNALWTLPAKRRKLPTHIKNENRAQDALLIPLSSQVLDIFRELHRYTGKGVFCFPSNRGKHRPFSNNALRLALRNLGYDKETITPHGFRGVASTFLHTFGYRSEVIEAQLGHKDKDAIRAAYNHATYIEERTTMMQEWSNYLDTLRTGADVIPIRQNRA